MTSRVRLLDPTTRTAQRRLNASLPPGSAASFERAWAAAAGDRRAGPVSRAQAPPAAAALSSATLSRPASPTARCSVGGPGWRGCGSHRSLRRRAQTRTVASAWSWTPGRACASGCSSRPRACESSDSYSQNSSCTLPGCVWLKRKTLARRLSRPQERGMERIYAEKIRQSSLVALKVMVTHHTRATKTIALSGE